MPNNAHLHSPHATDQARLSSTPTTNLNSVFNQNTTNNTNVQITQNTYNYNTNPSSAPMPQQATATPPPPSPQQQQQSLASHDTPRVLNQTIGSQTNVNVFLNQTVIQQPTVQTTTAANSQQQMVAISINGNQTLIPLSMFTKLLQQKCSSAQPTATVSDTIPLQVAGHERILADPDHHIGNDDSQFTSRHSSSHSPKWFDAKQRMPRQCSVDLSLPGSGSILLQNISNNPAPASTTLRFIRSPTTPTASTATSK